jgi:hypothetical protein
MFRKFFIDEYEDFELTKLFITNKKSINLHASCLVLKCIKKLLEML